MVRDGAAGIEVLLSRRAERGDYNSGAWVFPGGIVDAGDRTAHAACAGLDDAEASARLGVARRRPRLLRRRDPRVLRGIGAAVRAQPAASSSTSTTARPRRLAPWRGPLHRGERALAEMCSDDRLRLAVDRLVYLSHWLTPLGRAKRFDTRFFIAAAPPVADAAHDGTEMVEQLWLRPAEALARSATR